MSENKVFNRQREEIRQKSVQELMGKIPSRITYYSIVIYLLGIALIALIVHWVF
ncbi:MAG TPA: hypothetical protein VGO45_10230 [Bacteroidia bacterium]|jgi:hypothetical protein|nr:hypothetical protein [Bacteroidia bacterium]